jgi:hypothetical protein
VSTLIIDFLRTHLAAQTDIPLNTIYLHRMGEVPAGVLLRLPPDGIKHDWNMPGYHCTNLQAIVRHADQEAGDTMADKVERALKISNMEFSTAGTLKLRIKQMYPMTKPIIYPRSDGNGIEWSLTFKTHLDLYG